jgi:hypothetical protein
MPPVLTTDRIAYLNTAGDCCAAGFQFNLCRVRVIGVEWTGSTTLRRVRCTSNSPVCHVVPTRAAVSAASVLLGVFRPLGRASQRMLDQTTPGQATPTAVQAEREPSSLMAALAPAQLLQSFQKRRETSLPFRIVGVLNHEHPDAPYPLGLLRTRRERPRCRHAAATPPSSVTKSRLLTLSPRQRATEMNPECSTRSIAQS